MPAGGFGINVEVEGVHAQVKIHVQWGDEPSTEDITTLLTEAYAAAVKRTFEERPSSFKKVDVDAIKTPPPSQIILPGELR